jgi:DNA-binding PadR family transcriptional regulator
MGKDAKLTHTATMILQAVGAGHAYGLSVIEVTGLPSGTVYPALRRLCEANLVRSSWEPQKTADAEKRPPRRYYKLTAQGRERLEAAQKRYPLLAALAHGRHK